ncbi:hypothetical protein Hypma_003969 [Hypsizygus marmoreus]|uniref:Uncharacterized protein n=1 Tax=Hypsizygus marmoreus TaxID=39966 RepID=A0A369J155_HYPMA|nr:hypothetical protein Hypma_003969 [Hypsizygus marmoreus]
MHASTSTSAVTVAATLCASHHSASSAPVTPPVQCEDTDASSAATAVGAAATRPTALSSKGLSCAHALVFVHHTRRLHASSMFNALDLVQSLLIATQPRILSYSTAHYFSRAT